VPRGMLFVQYGPADVLLMGGDTDGPPECPPRRVGDVEVDGGSQPLPQTLNQGERANRLPLPSPRGSRACAASEAPARGTRSEGAGG